MKINSQKEWDEFTLNMAKIFNLEQIETKLPDQNNTQPIHSDYFFDWTGIKNSDETKQLKSNSTKDYWNSSGGLEKKKRLIERNKTKHSKVMLERWKNPTDNMKNRIVHGRPKGSKDIGKRKQKEVYKIWVNGVIYENAEECSKIHNIHPVNVRRRCRLPQYDDWRYVNENCFID